MVRISQHDKRKEDTIVAFCEKIDDKQMRKRGQENPELQKNCFVKSSCQAYPPEKWKVLSNFLWITLGLVLFFVSGKKVSFF